MMSNDNYFSKFYIYFQQVFYKDIFILLPRTLTSFVIVDLMHTFLYDFLLKKGLYRQGFFDH